jgi:multidrug efflux pump subunit AcrB
LAKKQFEFQTETMSLQQELIDAQRNIAESNLENIELLREISAQSLDRTREQLSLTEDIVDNLNQSLTTLESATASAQNEALILSTKQLKSQFLSARSQLLGLISQSEYQVDQNNPPTELARLSREVTLKQLDLQEKSLTLNLEVSQLNVRIANLNASLSYPVAPFSGRIERIHVRYGQAVNPGMPLVTLSGGPQSISLVATIPYETVKIISRLEAASITQNGQKMMLPIVHISEPFPDQMSRVSMSVPQSIASTLSDQQLVTVNVPIGYPQSQTAMPVIPIDSVHITQEAAYVFLFQDNTAFTQVIELGQVIGDKVVVNRGLSDGDAIIRERNIASGDIVMVKSQNMSSYLKKLAWSPALKQGLVPGLLTNIRLTLLVVAAIIIGGMFGLSNLERRINPEVNIPIVFITTIFPGASSEDVEKLLTNPLESGIRGVSGVTQFRSNSQDNLSTIVIEFNASIDPDKARNDVQAAVDLVTNLPADAITPKVIRLDFEDVPVITFAITTDADDLSLMDFSRQLKKDLEDLPQIETAIISGFENSEITVAVSKEILNQYSLNPFSLSRSITEALSTYPSGQVRAEQSNISVAVELGQDKLAAIRNQPVIVEGQRLRLSEIANIMIQSQPKQPASYLATNKQQAKRAVTFSVFKTAGSDLETAAQQAKIVIEQAINRSGDRFSMFPITDFDQNIDDQFNDLLVDFLTSIVLVFLTLLTFLGIRQASISSFVIPLSFFATFAVMYLVDIQLSFLSIFSLLLGLGMIVDDTIVMVSAMTDYYASGKFTPSQTGLLVWRDFLGPTLSSNLTNIWSFLPLLIASGIIGEFTKVISIVVTIALIGSTLIALFVTIPLMITILKPPRLSEVIRVFGIIMAILPLVIFGYVFRQNSYLLVIIMVYGLTVLIVKMIAGPVKNHLFNIARIFRRLPLPNLSRSLDRGFINAKKPIIGYKHALLKILDSKSAKRQTLIAVISLSFFSYLLVPLGFVKNEFFPKTDEDIIYISVLMPAGTPLENSQQEGKRLLEEIRTLEGLEYALLDVGVDVDISSVNMAQTDFSRIRLSLRLSKNRTETSFALAAKVRDLYANYHAGEFQVVEISGGPPTGADIQLTVLGDDLKLLEEYAGAAKNYLEQQTGTANVELSVKPSTPKIIFSPDAQSLSQNNITLASLGSLIRQYASGVELAEIIIEDTECETQCPVMFRVDNTQLFASVLPAIRISNPQGEDVPLNALGTFTLSPNPVNITHVDGTRSLSVQASVIPGFNQVEIGTSTLTYVQNDLKMQSGYSWVSGGANEENERSVQSIIQAMGVAAILILATMVIELRSFKRAFIVMLAIPLAISGVFIMFALTNTPLSFPALIGVLALFGIVVKNSIMIVDKINRNLEIGLPFNESIADGAASRLEPIIFSSITNIIGLLPITLSDPLWRGLGGAIISGLSLSGIIMLIFIPVVFDVWYRKRYTA